MSDLIPSSLGNSILGTVLFALAAALTFLMFYVWKFPYDHEWELNRKQGNPPEG